MIHPKWDKAMRELAAELIAETLTADARGISRSEAAEAVLRERLEPLLDRAEAVVAAHDPKHPHSVEWNLGEELSKWAR